MLEQLEALCRQQHLNDLDLHFVRLMVRLAGDSTPELVLGASLVSHWTGNGHVCIDLHELADRPLLEGRDDAPRAPELNRWLAALQACPVVGRPGDYRPLVLDGQGRLYLYRYWDYERQLAEDLLARVMNIEPVNENRLHRDLQTLFPASDDYSGPDWQKLAAVAAVLKRFCVISGGPGTGKTTTVIRMLVLLLGQAGRPLRIRLAAPTGKAAARMQEAIRLTKQQLDLEPALREAIPEEAFTLHRLLGAQPDSVYFRHHRDNPLALDVLVVDEASMVDLALMTKLVQALPAHARFILLGDRDQLASVEAGAVLGDICGSAGFSESFQDRLQALTGEQIPATEVPGSPLQDSIVLLQHSYRFGPASGIGRLARLVNRGQGSAALELLESGRFSDILWQSLTSFRALREGIGRRVESGFRPYLEQLRAGSAPAEILAAFNRFRVLCALRTGPAGVQTLNRLIEDILQDRRLINARALWYPGRPVMITRNDYNLRLFNGDVGIALEDPQSNGRLRVFFQATDGSLRGFPPRRLPEHQTVYAMTIHKSQGSEFDSVLMVLPFEDSRIMTRELVYTGITRARSRVEIWGQAIAFKAAVARRIRRFSGLRDRLWAIPPGSLND